MFEIVFRDSSFYPKQLSLFYLLWLISANADCIGYVPISVQHDRTVARAQQQQLLT